MGVAALVFVCTWFYLLVIFHCLFWSFDAAIDALMNTKNEFCLRMTPGQGYDMHFFLTHTLSLSHTHILSPPNYYQLVAWVRSFINEFYCVCFACVFVLFLLS
jgi:hypothetical protein